MTQHNGTLVHTDRRYSADTDLVHIFKICKFTISYIMFSRSQMECEFPKYVLESKDGTYYQERSVGSHLIDRGDYMQIQFTRLEPGTTYKLTRHLAEHIEEVIFDNAPFARIVDQSRDIHKILEDHAYGEFKVATGESVDDFEWGSDANAED